MSAAFGDPSLRSQPVKKSHGDPCHSEPPKRSEGRSRNPLRYTRFARSAGDPSPSSRLGMTLRYAQDDELCVATAASAVVHFGSLNASSGTLASSITWL